MEHVIERKLVLSRFHAALADLRWRSEIVRDDVAAGLLTDLRRTPMRDASSFVHPGCRGRRPYKRLVEYRFPGGRWTPATLDVSEDAETTAQRLSTENENRHVEMRMPNPN